MHARSLGESEGWMPTGYPSKTSLGQAEEAIMLEDGVYCSDMRMRPVILFHELNGGPVEREEELEASKGRLREWSGSSAPSSPLLLLRKDPQDACTRHSQRGRRDQRKQSGSKLRAPATRVSRRPRITRVMFE